MTHVFLNGRFLAQRTTGVQRYAREVLAALDLLLAARRTQLTLEVLAPPGVLSPGLARIAFRNVGRLRGHAWEQLELPCHVGRSWLLSFCASGPILKKRQIVTMHDAAVHAVPDAYSRAFRAWYGVLLPTLARRTPHVMTVSEFARDELVRAFGARREATHVSGEGYQHVTRLTPDRRILARHGLRPKRYVLAVSSVARHKNFAVVARALGQLAALDYEVVVAGALDGAVFGRLDRGTLGALKLVGYVRDEELCALLEGAAAFVHPSLYEGFGLPPLEAMALGCPVVAARAAAVPEVCGDAALYFDPRDPTDLARQLRTVLSDPALQRTLSARGRARLAAHGWERAAARHLDLLERAVAHARMPRPDAALSTPRFSA